MLKLALEEAVKETEIHRQARLEAERTVVTTRSTLEDAEEAAEMTNTRAAILEADNEALAATVTKSEAELRSALQEKTRAETQLAGVQGQAEMLENSLDVALAETEAVRNELQAVAAQVGAAQSKATSAQAEVEDAVAARNALRDSLGDVDLVLGPDPDEKEAEVGKWMARAMAAEAEANDLASHLRIARGQVVLAETKVERVLGELEVAQITIASLQSARDAELAAFQAELARLRQVGQASLQSLSAAHEAELDRLAAKAKRADEDAETRLSELEEMILAMQHRDAARPVQDERVARLKAQLAAAEDELLLLHKTSRTIFESRMAEESRVEAVNLSQYAAEQQEASVLSSGHSLNDSTTLMDLESLRGELTYHMSELDELTREHNRVNAAYKDLSELHKAALKQLEEREAAEIINADAQMELEEMHEANLKLRRKLEKTGRALASARAKAEAAERSAASAGNGDSALLDRIHAAEARSAEAERKLDAARSRSAADANQWALEKDELRTMVSSLQAVVAQVQVERSSQASSLHDLNALAASLNESAEVSLRDTLSAKEAESASRIQALRADNDALVSRNSILASKLRELQDSAANTKAELQSVLGSLGPCAMCGFDERRDDVAAVQTEIGLEVQLAIKSASITPHVSITTSLVFVAIRSLSVSSRIISQGSGFAVVSFVPPRVGVYDLHVNIDGLPMDASPLRVDVVRQAGRILASVTIDPDLALVDKCAECGARGRHRESCSEFLDLCTDCGERVRTKDLERHLEVWCSERQVVCAVCTSVLRVADYATHMSRHVAAFKAKAVVDEPDTHFGVFICENHEGGARIVSVRPGQPAAEAGLRANDVITCVDGVVVESQAEFARVVRTRCVPTVPVQIDYIRQSELYTVTCVPEQIGLSFLEFEQLKLLAAEWLPDFDPRPLLSEDVENAADLVPPASYAAS